MNNNPYLTAMTFMSNLQSVYGVHYENNPALVDARFPSLIQMTSNVTVDGCDRLCPARYTIVGTGPSDVGCASRRMEYYFRVLGDAKQSDLPVLAGVFAKLVLSLAQNAVRCMVLFFS